MHVTWLSISSAACGLLGCLEVEMTGFKLSFTFKENPYFTNTVSS
jgi:hypothetical protein